MGPRRQLLSDHRNKDCVGGGGGGQQDAGLIPGKNTQLMINNLPISANVCHKDFRAGNEGP